MFRFSHMVVASILAVAPLAARAEDPSAATVLATVNGTDITLGHVIALYATLPPEYQGLPAEQLFSGLLDQLTQQQILADSNGELALELKLRLENEARQSIASAVVTRIADAAISDDLLKQAYDDRYANAAPGKEFHAAHILVDTKEKADEILAKIRAGEDFGELAKANSSDTSAQSGGDLGWFGLGVMVKPFEDAVLSLKAGEVSEPVESQFGWHIVKLLEDRLLETPSFDQVKDKLSDDLRREAVEAEMEKLTLMAKMTKTDLSGFDPEIVRKTDLLK